MSCPECGSPDKLRRLHQLNYLPPAECIHPWHSPAQVKLPDKAFLDALLADRDRFKRNFLAVCAQRNKLQADLERLTEGSRRKEAEGGEHSGGVTK